ncbi:MAG: Na/Pi symporter, partial [Tistlia sp.]
MIETLAQILAGLGLFFAGLELLSANLRGMTSRRFQRAVGGWTATPGKGFAWGALAGALTQSSAVVTFIVVGLLVAGMTVVVRGLPLIVGSNLGAGALLFIVSLDFGPAVLVLTGLVGLGVTIERLRPWRQGLWALFGIALLFVGLSLLKEGTAPLADSETVRSLLESTAGSHLLAFLIGAVLTVVVNSSVAIGVLSMSLMASGVLSFETTAMVIYGTNLGSSATTYLLSMKLRGEARQLAMYQVAFNVVGCLVFLPLFFIETMTSLPLSLALLEWLSDDPATRVAWAYLL